MSIRVAAIGSCRVYTPLALMAQAGEVTLAHGAFDWFTHSSRDAIQKIKIVSGQLVLPGDYVPVVINELKKYKPETHGPAVFDDTDVFIVEICSSQHFEHGGIALQQWRMRDFLVDGVAPSATRDIALQADSTLLSAQEVLDDIGVIHEMIGLKPLLLVSHNRAPRPDGSVPKARYILLEALQKAAERPGVALYDPTDDILAAGVDEALKDPAHYRPAFEPVIGRHLVAHAKALLARTQR